MSLSKWLPCEFEQCHPLLWGAGILVDHWSTISSFHLCHSWKSLENWINWDKKIIIHGKPNIIICFYHSYLNYEVAYHTSGAHSQAPGLKSPYPIWVRSQMCCCHLIAKQGNKTTTHALVEATWEMPLEAYTNSNHMHNYQEIAVKLKKTHNLVFYILLAGIIDELITIQALVCFVVSHVVMQHFEAVLLIGLCPPDNQGRTYIFIFRELTFFGILVTVTWLMSFCPCANASHCQ